jgi:methylmalonyl-CoA/ethylmalonyl-CoA epimerase
MNPKVQLSFHHVGCLTKNMDETLSVYLDKMGFRKVSEPVTVSSQQVKVCFIQTADGPLIELIQPLGNNQALGKLLQTKNFFYHIGYMTKDIDQAIQYFQESGFYFVNSFLSEAFENRKCAFLYTGEMHLIELIEEKNVV